ncbi:hypothetical protein RMCBS344292_15577 [Rhizopus microsporus]|nr:hypothetical protein RMCBS344292_15577 [Rhizopus microsporus]
MEEMGGLVRKIGTKSRSYSIQSWYSSRVPSSEQTVFISASQRVLHSDKPSLAPHEKVQQFFQAKKRIDLKLPNYMKDTYSLTPIIDMIRSWGPTKGLRLKKLQEKTVLLLAVAN